MNDTDHDERHLPKVPARQLWRLLGGYWRSDDRLMAWLLLLSIPALHGVMVYQGLLQNRIYGVMFDALGDRQASVFWRQLILTGAVMATWVLAHTLVEWLMQLLYMRWRTWLNAYFSDRWLERKAYYRMDRAGSIDNPDQRLSEDLQILTEKGVTKGFEFLHQMGVVVVFTGVLWNLSRDIAFTVAGQQVAIPGLVVFVFLGFCLLSTGLVEWLGRPLLRARYRQQAREGDYRFALVRVRENAEPIALYAGEASERRRLGGAFGRIRQNWRKVVRHTFSVNLATDTGNQGVQLLPWVLGAGAYFAGGLSLGQLTRLHQTCNQTRIGLLWFIQNYTELADVRAALARLVELDHALDTHDARHDIVVADSQDEVLRTYALALECPDGRALGEPVSADIKAGSSCVIVGPSGLRQEHVPAVAGRPMAARTRPHRDAARTAQHVHPAAALRAHRLVEGGAVLPGRQRRLRRPKLRRRLTRLPAGASRPAPGRGRSLEQAALARRAAAPGVRARADAAPADAVPGRGHLGPGPGHRGLALPATARAAAGLHGDQRRPPRLGHRHARTQAEFLRRGQAGVVSRAACTGDPRDGLASRTTQQR